MKSKKRLITWIVLIAIALLLKIFSLFPPLVEQYYSHGLYPVISRVQRIIFGWLPISFGDIFYAVIVIYLLKKIVVFIKRLSRKEIQWNRTRFFFEKLVFVCLWIYVLFNVLWGLNYNRVPVSKQFGLEAGMYRTGELDTTIQLLIHELNAFDSVAYADREIFTKKKMLFSQARAAYDEVEKSFPQLIYRTASVKPSLFSYAGNVFGYTGYYNPFSGEAQVNTTVPVFVQPFTTCHEIGHQLGYAKENEANFAGFLAARSSSNLIFRYSVYFDMYSYAIRDMFARDSMRAKSLHTQIDARVLKDFKTLQQFYKDWENPVEPVIRKLYAQYLKANQQPQGMKSYNQVVGLMIAYWRKYGTV